MKELNRREFTNGFVAALELEDGMKIETTATYLPMTTEMRGTGLKVNTAVGFSEGDWTEKFMVGVSTQSGCPIKCKFCAVNELTRRQGWRNLTTDEIVGQVEWAIEQAGANPEDAKLFRILFTRMGEPALNIDNLLAAMRILKQRYPNARMQVSTIGMKKLSYRLICELMRLQGECLRPFIELQFSVHTTNNHYRRWLQGPKVVDLEAVAQWCRKWMEHKTGAGRSMQWTPTLNFSLAEDTPFDVAELSRVFCPDDCFIKLSPINENTESDRNNLKSLLPNNNEV